METYGKTRDTISNLNKLKEVERIDRPNQRASTQHPKKSAIFEKEFHKGDYRLDYKKKNKVDLTKRLN